MPPAAPCTVRATSSSSIFGASAQPSVPTPKMASVSRYDALGPNLTRSGLTAAAATTEPTRYTAITHA